MKQKTKIKNVSDLIEVLEIFRRRHGDDLPVYQWSLETLCSVAPITGAMMLEDDDLAALNVSESTDEGPKLLLS